MASNQKNYLHLFLAPSIMAGAVLFIKVLHLFHLLPLMPLDDFVVLWAPARALLQGENPYSPSVLRAIATEIGWAPERKLLLMYHPPTMLGLFSPIGLLDYHSARLLWLVLSCLLVLFATVITWGLLNAPRSYLPKAIAVSFLFIPSLRALGVGQCTPLILAALAVLLFASLHQRHFLWGTAIAVIALKPHIAYLILGIAGAFAVQKRWWQGLLSAICVSGILALLALGIRPSVFQEWYHLVSQEPPAHYASTSWGIMLRVFFGTERFWLQFIPPLLGTVWGCWFYWTKRSSFDWLTDGMIVILVSLLSFPYGWDYDYILAVIPVLAILCRASQSGLASITFFVVSFSAFCGILIFMLAASDYQWLLVWMGPALLLWYRAATDKTSRFFSTKDQTILS